jgi:hypothetical protein
VKDFSNTSGEFSMPNKATHDAMLNIINYLMVEFFHRTNKDKILTWDALLPDAPATETTSAFVNPATQQQKDFADRADNFLKLITWICAPISHKLLIEKKVDKAEDKNSNNNNNNAPPATKPATVVKLSSAQNANLQLIEHLETIDKYLDELYLAQKNSKGRDFDFSRNIAMRTANTLSFGYLPGSTNYIWHCAHLKNLYKAFLTPEFKKKVMDASLSAAEDKDLKECWRSLQETALEIRDNMCKFIVEPAVESTKNAHDESAAINKDVGIILVARLFSNFMNTSSLLPKKDFIDNAKNIDLLNDMIKIQLRMGYCDPGRTQDWTDRSRQLTVEYVEPYQGKSTVTLPVTLKASRTDAIRAVVNYVTDKASTMAGTTEIKIDQAITNLYLADCVNPIQEELKKAKAANK